MVQLALQLLGAVHVPLLGGLSFEELAYQVEHSGGELVIADEPVASALVPRIAECPGVRQVVLVGDASVGSELRFERPAAPRSAARRTARRLRRPVADGHPLHVRQHRAAQGGDAAGRLVLQLWPGVRRALRHRRGRQLHPARAARARDRRADGAVDRFPRRVPPDGRRPLQPVGVLGPGGGDGRHGDDPLPRPAQPAAGGGARVAAAGPHAAAVGDHSRLERALPPVLRRRARHGLGHDGDRRALRRQRPRRGRRRRLHRRAHDRSGRQDRRRPAERGPSRDGRRDLPPPPPRHARLSTATSRPPPPPWWTAGCARAISVFVETTAGSTSPAGSRT